MYTAGRETAMRSTYSTGSSPSCMLFPEALAYITAGISRIWYPERSICMMTFASGHAPSKKSYRA